MNKDIEALYVQLLKTTTDLALTEEAIRDAKDDPQKLEGLILIKAMLIAEASLIRAQIKELGY